MRHLLKKQILDVNIGFSLDAFSVQHYMSGHYWRHIFPILEKIFDELGESDHTIKIDTIEIDLGSFTQKDVEQFTWNTSFLAELEQKLRTSIQLAVEQKTETDEPREMVVFSQWLYYMKNGFLPWNSIDLKEENNTVLETLATEYSSITALRELLLSNRVARSRIIFQHKAIFLQNLVAVLTSKKQEGLHLFVDEIVQSQSVPGSQSGDSAALPLYRRRNEIWQYILQIASRQKQLTLEEIKQRVLRKYINRPPIDGGPTSERLVNKFPLPDSIDRKNGLPLENKDQLSKDPENVNTSLNEPIITKTKDENDKNLSLDNKSFSDIESPSSLKNFLPDTNDTPAADLEIGDYTQNGTPELDEGIFINLAGLVLVHPFLPTLFKKLNWVANGKFNNLENQQRALYLMHYIGSGSIEAEEHDLVSCKVLCAYPLQMPVPGDIDIETEAFREADNMLVALISQWEVLKQTSPDGLRQGFLQRNGKLYSRNERMCLQVEVKGIDVLLDRLPWNLSIIKLPWMKNIMSIEWR